MPWKMEAGGGDEKKEEEEAGPENLDTGRIRHPADWRAVEPGRPAGPVRNKEGSALSYSFSAALRP